MLPARSASPLSICTEVLLTQCVRNSIKPLYLLVQSKFREGRYQFPNDEGEQDRLDMEHAMVLNLCGGKLHFAPIEPTNILDAGTGTGIWAIDAGDEYPAAQVLGVDLSPIQPAFVPPNVRFVVDDIESHWLHGENTFDLVFLRHMNTGIKQWPPLLKEAYAHIKPGGWIELQEFLYRSKCDDGTVKEDYIVEKFFQNVKAGIETFGVDGFSTLHNVQRLKDAGFTNVEEKVFKIPIGPWAKNKTLKTVGTYFRSSLYDGLQGLAMAALTRGLGWESAEVERFLVDVRKGLLDPTQHAYITFHVVFGQKPLST